jgi:hypothetical protein
MKSEGGSSMKTIRNGFVAAAFLILSISAVEAQIKIPAVFDKPVSTQVIPLPPDPNNLWAKNKRSCYYYPNFMVKEEVDPAMKGAELAIVQITKGAKNPPCDMKNAGEIIITGKEWSGYFYGVKDDYVFFNAADGNSGGYPFAVYSGVTGRKLFKDSRHIKDDLTMVQSLGKGLELRYQRAFAASCSLFADAKDCWPKIVKATGIVAAAPPDCSKSYQAEIKRSPEFASQVSKSPSMIGYKVNARYAGGILTIKAIPGPVQCWAPE